MPKMTTPNATPRIALVTGADRGLGFALAANLLEKGWRVFAGQYMPEWPDLSALAGAYPDRLTALPLDVADLNSVRAAARTVAETTDHIDLVLNNAGVISPTITHPIQEAQDYDEMHRMYDVNAVGPLRVIDAFLSLIAAGDMKRLAFVSSESGSINRCERDAWYGYNMSKTALNMAVSMLFNKLRPDGYSFRVYHPGWIRSYMGGAKNPKADLEPEEAAVPAITYFLRDRADEDRLVMRDWLGREWPW
jgi:NAD(P)-dependent dehydrogenase (short-subunit alcohol dehydrogenase family)